MPMDWIMFDDISANRINGTSKSKDVHKITQAPLFSMPPSPLNGVTLNSMRLQKIPGGPKVPNII